MHGPEAAAEVEPDANIAITDIGYAGARPAEARGEPPDAQLEPEHLALHEAPQSQPRK